MAREFVATACERATQLGYFRLGQKNPYVAFNRMADVNWMAHTVPSDSVGTGHDNTEELI